MNHSLRYILLEEKTNRVIGMDGEGIFTREGFCPPSGCRVHEPKGNGGAPFRFTPGIAGVLYDPRTDAVIDDHAAERTKRSPGMRTKILRLMTEKLAAERALEEYGIPEFKERVATLNGQLKKLVERYNALDEKK